MAALAGVLGSGPVNGVLVGAAISIVLLLRQASRPRMAELVRYAGTSYFTDRARHPENKRTPGVLVVRCESSLLYFNTEYVRERVMEQFSDRTDDVRLVVLSLGSVPWIDLAGTELVADLHKTFGERGIAFRLANAHGQVRDALRRIGFERVYGPLQTGQTVDVVIATWSEQVTI